MEKAGKIELLGPDYENPDYGTGELHVIINDDNRYIFKDYFSSIDEVRQLAEDHKVYWLVLEDEVYNSEGKPLFGKCEEEPRRHYVGECKEEDSHREGTYKIILRKKSTVNLQAKQNEIEKIKSKFGIDINEDEFYYWIFFHELGHTFKGSGKYHTGAIVCDKTKEQELKEKQEELAEKYCLFLYRKWKANTI